MAASVPPIAGEAAISHSSAYRTRRFCNWFPLGITYAAFYMGRYNLNVVAGTIQKLFVLNKAEFGIILTAGFWTYALSVMFNGTLADRFLGGKRAIMIGTIGAALMNMLLGLMFWSNRLAGDNPLGAIGPTVANVLNTIVGVFGQDPLPSNKAQVLFVIALLYAINCYFQSFGAISVVKVNAPWFHVRERGLFGGIFGIMISSGYFLALSVGSLILNYFSWFAVFIIPAILLMIMLVVDGLLVRNTPKDAGFDNFDTGDASSGDEAPISWLYLLKQILSNRVILILAAAEFCTGFVRQGLMAYFNRFLEQVHHLDPKSAPIFWAGIGVTVGGILGGLLCGALSDKVFQSRRPPVALIFYVGQIIALLCLGWSPSGAIAAALVGFCCMWIFGVHGMLSGTASADFGGRKAAATATGLLDGVQYVASGFTGAPLGKLIDRYGWGMWTYSLIPFSVMGIILMATIWNAKPKKGSGH